MEMDIKAVNRGQLFTLIYLLNQMNIQGADLGTAQTDDGSGLIVVSTNPEINNAILAAIDYVNKPSSESDVKPN
jgi:hypothetical protein